MRVEILWPNGSTATFDGDTWAPSHDAPVSAADLALVPKDVSVTVPSWEYWHAVEVAAVFGAEVMDPPPDEPPEPVDDVVFADNDADLAEREEE